jgi:hypothetical protein
MTLPLPMWAVQGFAVTDACRIMAHTLVRSMTNVQWSRAASAAAGGRLLQYKGRTLLLAPAHSGEDQLLATAQAAVRRKAAVKTRRQQARGFQYRVPSNRTLAASMECGMATMPLFCVVIVVTTCWGCLCAVSLVLSLM